MNTTQQILNTAVVGCGAISDIYLENMIHHFDNLNVTACCANHLEHFGGELLRSFFTA